MGIHLEAWGCLDPEMLGERGPEAIRDCTQPGQDASEAVEFWREQLGFTVDPTAARDCLKGYGAWEPEELAEMSVEELAIKVLWIALGDFAEAQDGEDPIFCLE